jgi:tetratricopeptide (TPR) repeat protein
MPQKSTAKKPVVEDPRHTQALQNYEAGVRALQEQKFEKAKGHLQKVLSGPHRAMADRAAVHLHTCDQHLEKPPLQFKTPDEHFDYATSLMNSGDYVAAREHMERLLKQNPKADFVLYGLAALSCVTGRVEDALKNLGDAIRTNPALRFQARNDSDFQNLAEDPRFTELLYPDPAADAPASQEEISY